MNRIQQLARLGQSIWLDFISRSFLASGGMKTFVEQGVRGMTSNPTIFEKAIAGSADYDDDLRRLAPTSLTPEEIFYQLAIADIRAAAGLLRGVYDESAGLDGYVSLEVGPALAGDTAATIAEARRLFAAVDRPNIMIKVPATPQGLPAIRTLIGEGININITLMFSLAHYEAVTAAYLAGLEDLVARGGDPARVASVASFFVSRVDTLVDKELEQRGATELLGKTAVANSKLTYARFKEIFSGERWERLAAKGARVQRPLWASTSTKNPRYPDTLYVDNLIGPHTVNTVPQNTFEAVLDHGRVAVTIEEGLDEARALPARLAELGIDLDAVTEKLQVDGVAAFAKSFDDLLASIAAKRGEMQRAGWGEGGREVYTLGARRSRWIDLGLCRPAVEAGLAEMGAQDVMARLWRKDPTLWAGDRELSARRLGWLDAPQAMRGELDRLAGLARAARQAGYTHALLLGMGGSSLAPEVMSRIFGPQAGLELAVLDSTAPGAVLAHTARLDPARTLFIVSTKSGTTIETLSLFKFFYNWTLQAVGRERAGEHFVAITDPGSTLADLAGELHFRESFLNEPTIGGRYSALSLFGLLPAALLGLDVGRLLDRAAAMAAACGGDGPPEDNLAAWLGAALAEAGNAGSDKVTFVLSPAIASFGDWVEQLIAESTGKDGRGLLPVVGEPLRPPAVYGLDRLFVHLRLAGDPDGGAHDEALENLRLAGHPVVRLDWQDAYDLGGQFFLWGLATAVAGHRLGINPFDQPNVEAAKKLARDKVDAYKAAGTLPAAEPAPLDPAALRAFLDQARPGDYIALQAYLAPTPETGAALQVFRTVLRDRTRLATTVGYGPRYLHSTGQLHKGGANRGLFLQLTADDPQDVPIPDEVGEERSSMTFGVLKTAQAAGDRQALLDAGRRVLHLHLGAVPAAALYQLAQAILER